MEKSLKQYADELYLTAMLQSSQTCNTERITFLADRAARYSKATVPIMSGLDIKGIAHIHERHIGRCMLARLESYKQAFQEAGSVPSAEDFDDVLKDCQAVRDLQARHAATSLQSFVVSHGGMGSTPAWVPDENYLKASSARGHDDVLQAWKLWKAKIQLKPAAPQEDKKQVDTLTELFNRAEFNQDLASLSAKSGERSPLSLLFMDIDKFKSINDGPGGHGAGDRALKAFADAISGVCEGKGMAYRWGGDEFSVLLPNHTLDEALSVAERIRLAIGTIRSEELEINLSTSIGVANLPESTTDASNLWKLADQALYASKDAGRNCVRKAEPQIASSVDASYPMPNPAEWT